MSNINITKEAMKAETKLRNLRKRAAKAAQLVELAWAARERAYLLGISTEIKAVLRAAGYLFPGDYEPAKEVWVDLDPEPEPIPETLS